MSFAAYAFIIGLAVFILAWFVDLGYPSIGSFMKYFGGGIILGSVVSDLMNRRRNRGA